MIRKKKNKLTIAALLFCCCASAQQFRFAASLDTVNKDGFYSIPVSAELSSYLKTDLSDIRIADEKGQWIPHVINWSLKTFVPDYLYEGLQVLKSENKKNTTEIIAYNSDKIVLSYLLLELKNTAASRMAVISGSENTKNWFTITDSVLLSSPEIIKEKPTFKILFPSVNYNYFKITIFNGNKDPYNIEEVKDGGPFGPPHVREKFTTNPGTAFTQKDTAGFSLIRIENSKPFHFNKFTIAVTSPKFFERKAKLYGNVSEGSIKSLLRLNPSKEYILTSGNTDDYETPSMKDSVFYLLIENKDNPPLQIESIGTAQISKELIAYLEQGKQYRLLFNDPDATAPDYDLQKFRDRIPDSVLLLNAKNITALQPSSTVAVAEEKNINRKWLWPVIIGVIALLSFLTWSLTKDMKKS